MYSIMQDPMTACGCFECIAMVIPEANGVMVVSREDPSMTPAGMTFSTLAGVAGGGLQTPGMMGVGKYYLLSRKFISADGGFKRIVWMSSVLKDEHGRGAEGRLRARGRPRSAGQDRRRAFGDHGGGTAALLGGAWASGPDDGPDLLSAIQRASAQSAWLTSDTGKEALDGRKRYPFRTKPGPARSARSPWAPRPAQGGTRGTHRDRRWGRHPALPAL